MLTNCTYDGMCYNAADARAARQERRPHAFRRGVVRLCALQPDVPRPLRDAWRPATHPTDRPTVFARIRPTNCSPRCRRPRGSTSATAASAIDHGRFNEAYCTRQHLAAVCPDRLEGRRRRHDGRTGRTIADAGDASTRPSPVGSPWRVRARNSLRRRTGSSRRGMPTKSRDAKTGKRVPFHKASAEQLVHGSELLGAASRREVAWLRDCRMAGACSIRSSSASSVRA